MDPNELRQALIAATERWRQLDDARDKAREAVFQAAADYLLGSDVQAAEVALLTPFSDALVRAETRKLGVPERRRGPQRKREPKPESETSNPAAPVPTPAPPRPAPAPAFLSADSRVAELLSLAAALTPEEQLQAADRIRKRHAIWLRTVRPKPQTDAELITKAVRANVVTGGDLRP